MQNKGKIISGGVAIGKLVIYEKSERNIRCDNIMDTEREAERYNEAVTKVCEELDKLYKKALTEVGEAKAQIFAAQRLLVCDNGYRTSVEEIIHSEKVAAEYAVARTKDKYVTMFEAMEDEYLRARSADIKDISERVISVLTDVEDALVLKEPSIIVATELTPSETIKLDRRMVLGFVMETAAANSHVAILARSMGIPMLSGVKANKEWNDKMGAIDAVNGCVHVLPDKETIDTLNMVKDAYAKEKEQFTLGVKDKQLFGKDGRKVKLYANISGVEDAKAALMNGAEGIGLFRTEFLFLGREDWPTEDEQFEVYKDVAKLFDGKRVIIRTADIGADKRASYIGLSHEENPALGMRGIRLSLSKRDMFETQLRAILRAAAHGRVAVMFPMITAVDEVIQAKALLKEARAELVGALKECGEVEVGVMIETPAAALISDELAKLVDFFSIGTNDLMQYTLAADRQNDAVAGLYDMGHPAVLKLIRMAVKNAHESGIWAGVCGEAAANVELAKKFIELGVDELSVAPESVLRLKAGV